MNRYRSKTWATWIALLFGAFGLHRLYLRGARDRLAWLHPLPTLVGSYGAWRMDVLGVDDRPGWMLAPLLGLMLSQAALCAIVYGLTPDEKWDAARNPGAPPHATRWGPVLGAIFALLLLGTALMSTVAFTVQKFFEYQAG